MILIYIYFADFLKHLPKGLTIKKCIAPYSEPTKPPIPIQKNKIDPKTTSSQAKFDIQYEVISAKSIKEARQIQSSVGGLTLTGTGGIPMMIPPINLPKIQIRLLKPTSGNSQIVSSSGPQLFPVKSQQLNPTSTVVSSNETTLNIIQPFSEYNKCVIN